MKLSMSMFLLIGVALAIPGGLQAQANWFQLSPPSPRCCVGMAFYEAGSYTLLFGGVQGYYSTLGDTWKLGEGGWVQLAPPNSPTAREGPAMAYDAATQTVVLFGGNSDVGGAGADLNDTWIWDGTTWTNVTPVVSPPGRRFDGQGMAYDPASGTVLLFGGMTKAGTVLGDTWSWSGTTRTWAQQFPATSPSARNSFGLTHGGATGRVVLFGGYDGTNNLADTWVWNGSTWKQRFPASSPSPRGADAIAYDPVLQEVVLFGGNGFADTWTWNGTKWTQITPATAPPDRYNFGMDYDARAKSVVIFGGFSQCCGIQPDTWKLSVGP